MSTLLPSFFTSSSLATLFMRPLRQPLRRSSKASAMAMMVTLGAECSTLSAAPVPRPPQPIRPTLIASLPAGDRRRRRTADVAAAAPAADGDASSGNRGASGRLPVSGGSS